MSPNTARLVGKYDPQKWLNKVPIHDASGNEMPQWKKMLIAKQLAEKALIEEEEAKEVRLSVCLLSAIHI